MVINVEQTIREMIGFFEECAANAGEGSKAGQRFARFMFVLNLMLTEGEDADE